MVRPRALYNAHKVGGAGSKRLFLYDKESCGSTMPVESFGNGSQVFLIEKNYYIPKIPARQLVFGKRGTGLKRNLEKAKIYPHLLDKPLKAYKI